MLLFGGPLVIAGLTYLMAKLTQWKAKRLVRDIGEVQTENIKEISVTMIEHLIIFIDQNEDL
jgi:hypothetical protein